MKATQINKIQPVPYASSEAVKLIKVNFLEKNIKKMNISLLKNIRKINSRKTFGALKQIFPTKKNNNKKKKITARHTHFLVTVIAQS